jgi:hypothetical protein
MMAVLAGVFLIAAAVVPMASAFGELELDTVIIGFSPDADLEEMIAILEEDYGIIPLDVCPELNAVLIDAAELPIIVLVDLIDDDRLEILFIESNEDMEVAYT